MIIGFTGTRAGMSECQHDQLALVLQCFYVSSVRIRAVNEFHYGAAVGADTQAASIAESVGFRVKAHPAGDDPLTRNREIVAAVDVLIAAPLTNEEQRRSGTWATIRYARQAGMPVVMLSRRRK